MYPGLGYIIERNVNAQPTAKQRLVYTVHVSVSPFWVDTFSVLLETDQHMVADFENEAKCSATKKLQIHELQRRHPGRTGKVFGCVAEFKALDLEDKEAAVIYLPGKCNLVRWGDIKRGASPAHHMKSLHCSATTWRTLSIHCGNNKVEKPCSVSLSFQQKTNSVWFTVSFIPACRPIPPKE